MSDFLLVDASVAIKWLVNEEHSNSARTLLDDSAARDLSLVAPALLPAEVVNALYQVQRRGAISSAEADRALRRFLEVPIRIIAPVDLSSRALALAREFSLPATYDAHYLAISRWLDIDFWTADERLMRSMPPGTSWVRWIGECA
jgi:predicted nucleic acid-binding protein